MATDEDADPENTGFWRKDGTPINRLLGAAISVYVATRPEQVTIGEVASVFRISPERAVEAAEYEYWLFVTGDGPIADWIVLQDGD